MTTHRVRASSPSGPRIYLDAPRASTGTILTSTYDTRYDQRPPRASFSVLPSSSTQSSSRNNSVYETAQPVSKRTYHDPAHSGGTISRTEYAIRPRRDSNTAENRRPANIITKNVSPTREKFEKYDSPRDLVPYAKSSRDDTTRLRPTHTQGSGHHQRHNSATRAEAGRHFLGPEAHRPEREYHKRGPYVEKVADSRAPPPVARYVQDPTFEYTGPREQFDRDYPAPKPRRESLTRRERPNSAIGTKFEQVPSRRETAPPPSASRQLQRIERDERKSGFESDPERSREDRPRERPSRHPMKSAVVHQRDDGYSSARDDYDSRRPVRRPPEDDVSIASSKSRYHDTERDLERDRERPRREREREEERPREPARDRDRDRRERRSSKTGDREYERERERPRPREYEVIEEDDSQRRPRRREPRDIRDDSPERGSGLKTLATAALGGLAATGVANFKSRKDDEGSDSDSRKGRKHRRRRSRERREDDGHVDEDPEERRRRRRERQAQKDDSSGSDTPDDRNRPQSRTRRRRDTQDGYGSDRERAQAALAAPPPDRRPSRDPDPDAARGESAREPIPNRAQQESPTNNEGRTLSPGEGEDGRPRRVSIVEPTKKEEIKPKGILKPPRSDPFPEDPNPTREGVAPLKQAGKDGVPAGARWTKVSRILVNPEALERYHERFEERDDYVIVLRVLSREEIEKLAEKTREIREAREREWQKEVEERKRRRAERGDRDTEDEDGYDEGSEPRRAEPLAIEPPPSVPPVDLRQFAAQNNAQQQAQMAYASPQQQQPGYAAQQQQAYPPQQSYPPQQGYQSQQLPHEPQRQPQQIPQMQQQQQPQPLYSQAQWSNPTSARNSGEAIANTAPGQPLPPRQDQGQYDGTYSQNV